MTLYTGKIEVRRRIMLGLEGSAGLAPRLRDLIRLTGNKR